MDPSVYPYVCGYAVADGVLLPGETVRIEVDVDTDVCGDSALYSLVGMLGEFSLNVVRYLRASVSLPYQVLSRSRCSLRFFFRQSATVLGYG